MRPIGGVMRGADRCVAALAGALAEPVSPSLVSDGDSKPPLVTRLPPSPPSAATDTSSTRLPYARLPLSVL